jgi:predicted RNA polymerase sigma factor
LAQEVLVKALEKWPESGKPEKPGAWLMTAAKRRGIDLLRRNKLCDQKYEEIGRNMI